MADQDPSQAAKADLAKVPSLLDQYRQQRAAWLAQADELVRMREEVRQAAEREALEIVTAARRDVRRIIVDARRDLLVLTAQLHAAVEATDAPGLEMPSFAALLTEPERDRVEGPPEERDITRDVVLEARKGVRSVLDEARAEIDALSAEAPAAFAAVTSRSATLPGDWHVDAPAADEEAPVSEANPPAATDDDKPAEGPVHELNLDSALSALDFQTRDLPIPTLAHILGTEPDLPASTEAPAPTRTSYEPLSFDTPRMAELRSLLRDAPPPAEPTESDRGPVLSPDVEPSASAPLAFDTTPRSNFFAGLEARLGELPASPATDRVDATATADTPRFTPPSRLFGDQGDSQTPARSARTLVGLFAAAGALAVAGTLWWAFTRETPELSAAAPSTVAGTGTPATQAITRRAPGTMALTIEARRPSWIRAEIDGKDETGRVYQAGETRHIEGAHAVSIRAADAGAVFVGVDGAAARALGPNGQAATKEFAAAAPVATPAVATRTNSAIAPVVATAPAVTTDAPLARRSDVRPVQPVAAPPATATAASAPAPVPPEGVSGARPDLVQAGQHWLDAYQRRDRDAMATTGTDNITVSDERSVTERFPAWQSNVRRDLDQVELELTGDTALLTARMTEQAENGQGGEHVSRVSQIWLRRNGRWRLADVRIIGEARLNQIIR